MNPAIHFFLVFIAPPLAFAMIYLGVVTSQGNLLGWFLILIGAGYLVGGVVLLRQVWNRGKVTREESGDQSFWAILPGFLAVFFGAPIESLVFPKDLLNDARIQIAGLALIAAGLLLHVWASYHLQELFSGHIQIKSGHRLVMNGPYRSIRHPVYAAYMVITLGVAVGFTSLVGMAAIALLLAPGLAYRMKVEEKLLEEEFGVVYQKYAAGTRRLVPWLW